SWPTATRGISWFRRARRSRSMAQVQTCRAPAGGRSLLEAANAGQVACLSMAAGQGRGAQDPRGDGPDTRSLPKVLRGEPTSAALMSKQPPSLRLNVSFQ